jgi:subtilisin family serine protease
LIPAFTLRITHSMAESLPTLTSPVRVEPTILMDIGTHVASIAAGNNHVDNGKYTGIAPEAKIINVRVLNSVGAGSMSNAIAGIDWCIANKSLYNIRVLNMSFGSVAVDSYVNDPLCQAVRRAFNAGIVVCVAAGNVGKDLNGTKIFGAIHSPGIEPSAITVGAANTLGTNSRADDTVATYSSRGPTRGYYTDTLGVKHYDNLVKPDLIAPGNKIIAVESPNNQILSTTPSLDANVSFLPAHEMMYMSGTSMATPSVAAAAALLIQRNPSLTPNLVKAILQYTSKPLAGFSNFEQGSGELNVEGAVRLAALVRTDLAGRSLGDPLLSGRLQPKQRRLLDRPFHGPAVSCRDGTSSPEAT